MKLNYLPCAGNNLEHEQLDEFKSILETDFDHLSGETT
jgi:hypothetical protein